MVRDYISGIREVTVYKWRTKKNAHKKERI
jgi:hypothetical protein